MDDALFFVPIDMIRVSSKQTRKICQAKVRAHLAEIDAGNEPMPIDVRRLDDGSYAIAGNGRHRYFAYLAAGFPTIPVCLKTSRWEHLIRVIGRLLRKTHFGRVFFIQRSPNFVHWGDQQKHTSSEECFCVYHEYLLNRTACVKISMRLRFYVYY